MRCLFLTALLVVTAAVPAQARQGFPPASFAQPAQLLRSVDLVALPSVDVAALQAEDEKALAEGRGGPERFAAAIPVDLDAVRDGTWETLPDGSRIWRLRLVSPGALSLNFGFGRFRLPDGATVHFYPVSPMPAAMAWDGPYETADASPEGEFWTAVIPGDDAVVELWVPADPAFEPDLVMTQVGHDYRGFGGLARALFGPGEKQGTCNNDVICPEGDPWRNEIRSAACYSTGGSRICSGTLINSHDPARPPYFLTANHCGVNTSNDQSVVVYWNYESPTCGALSGGSLAQHQTGAEWKANYSNSDFCLVRLAAVPLPTFNVYYAGWDAREATMPARAVCIHHPGTKEKAISFCNTPLTTATYLQTPAPGDGTHWRVHKWDDGTTEPGSSGSGLWDPSHRLVGQLHGGSASCGLPDDSDYFGRLSRSWEGGGAAGSRLKTWLDPAGSNVLYVDGHDRDGGTALAGDADLSGGVSTQDLVAIANHILGTQLLSGQGFLNADRNYDGRLSVVDLVAVVNIILQGKTPANGPAGPVAVSGDSANEAPSNFRASIPGVVDEAVELDAVFDPFQRSIVFTIASPPGGAPGTGRGAGPAAISLVLAADPGMFASGLLPVRFPEGGGWQGMAMTAADGTVRAVLFDPNAGASMAPPSFALPVVGDAGDVRWIEGDAAGATASALRLTASGFPVQIGPVSDGGPPARVTLAVHPNPARGACILRYVLPHAGEAVITLYDPAGRVALSRTLGRVAAGSGSSELTAEEAAALAPGLCFVRLTLDGRHAGTARFILAR
jgi:prepilin-type processing-associated H-X9-DG protein